MSVVYSNRFPLPIFYLVEMVYPFSNVHPISPPIYILALAGLGFMLWRRNRTDKFCLIWFLVLYIAFTIIPNKGWRYITLVFPVLAISASGFLLFIWDKAKERLKKRKISLPKINIMKLAGAIFISLLAASVVYSSVDAYVWVQKYHFYVPIERATQYVARQTASNETVVVLSVVNEFNVFMVKFYLQLYDANQVELKQYPKQPVDSYFVVYNATELIEMSQKLHVKYLMLYEYGNLQYFESELTYRTVLEMLINTGRFVIETEFGNSPNRIFIISFSLNSTKVFQPQASDKEFERI